MPSDLRNPIRVDQIPEVFSDLAIKRALDAAGLSVEATIQERLCGAIRASASAYAVAVQVPTQNKIRAELEDLAQALDGGRGRSRNFPWIAKMWAELSPEARRTIERRLEVIREQEISKLEAWDLFATRHGRKNPGPRPLSIFAEARLPSRADLEDPQRQADAADLLFRVVVTGRGRNFSDEGRAYGPIRLRVHAPTPSRREPRREAERNLVLHLWLDWLHVTGTEPTLTARHNVVGPIAKFIAEILRLARVPIKGDHDHDRRGLAVETLNRLAAIRRRRQAERSLGRILKPLRMKDGLVDQVQLLVVLGEADVLRVSAEADCIHDPSRPALIEFQDAGTVCFYRSPFNSRTIAIKAFPRRRVMDIAARIARANAGKQQARVAAKRRRDARAAAKDPKPARPVSRTLDIAGDDARP
jgi:hypothetical protein